MNVRDLETIDFRTLTIYVNACQLLNLTQCAEQLGLPKSTVSKEITKLEQNLQVKLLERSTRKITMTEAGQIVYARANQLVDDFAGLRQCMQVLETEVQGLLKIAAPPALGEYLSRQVIPQFLKRWPKVNIALQLSYSFEDLFSQNIDLAFRVGRIDDDRLVARKIGEATRILVASPEYLAEHGEPQTPTDLQQHNCVRFEYSPTDTDWTLCSGEQSQSVAVSGNFFCASTNALKQAALNGLGIAQQSCLNIRDEVQQGKLKRVLPDWHIPPMPVHVVYRSAIYKPKKLQAMLDFLDEMAGEIGVVLR